MLQLPWEPPRGMLKRTDVSESGPSRQAAPWPVNSPARQHLHVNPHGGSANGVRWSKIRAASPTPFGFEKIIIGDFFMSVNGFDSLTSSSGSTYSIYLFLYMLLFLLLSSSLLSSSLRLSVFAFCNTTNAGPLDSGYGNAGIPKLHECPSQSETIRPELLSMLIRHHYEGQPNLQ